MTEKKTQCVGRPNEAKEKGNNGRNVERERRRHGHSLVAAAPHTFSVAAVMKRGWKAEEEKPRNEELFTLLAGRQLCRWEAKDWHRTKKEKGKNRRDNKEEMNE
ncbi:hypothetical protein niasHT_004669 [Heterodera trifolii]|uniref:Uncharacterized protein n=1 Tax=Heterodera trifolii TaxID=157864 RepID=A0ABD2M984_9BILA